MPYGYGKLSTLDPLQQQNYPGAYDQASMQGNPLFQSGSNWLMQLLQGGSQAEENFAAPYMRQFREQTIPELSTLFGGAGAGSSSGFQQALGQAGAGLQENLASLRSGLQMQALPQALGYAQTPFSNLQSLLGMNTQALVQKQPSFLKQMLLALTGTMAKTGEALGGAYGTALATK